MDERVVSVAVPLPFQAPFSYRLPKGTPRPERGVRVLVPFGGRRAIGVVVGSGDDAKGRELGQTLKDVVAGARRGAARAAAAARPGRLGRRPLPRAAGRVLPAGAAARRRSCEPGGRAPAEARRSRRSAAEAPAVRSRCACRRSRSASAAIRSRGSRACGARGRSRSSSRSTRPAFGRSRSPCWRRRASRRRAARRRPRPWHACAPRAGARASPSWSRAGVAARSDPPAGRSSACCGS